MNINRRGFTILELLIVIVVIVILAAISVVAYTGIQARANDAKRASDIRQVAKLIEIYHAENGVYPSTGGLNVAFADSNCTNANPNKSDNWVPGFSVVLPQSFGPRESGYGCYIYASNGTQYILSAWRALETGPQTSLMYRRFGFRESSWSHQDGYHCNTNSGLLAYWDDGHYKQSYTISNITACNESW